MSQIFSYSFVLAGADASNPPPAEVAGTTSAPEAKEPSAKNTQYDVGMMVLTVVLLLVGLWLLRQSWSKRAD